MFAFATPHFRENAGAWRAWLTEPAGMVTVMGPGHGSRDASAWIIDHVCVEMRQRLEPPYIYLHDWTRLNKTDSDSRRLIQSWGKTSNDQGLVKAVTFVEPPNVMLRMSMTAGFALLRSFGMNIAPVKTLDEAMHVNKARVLPSLAGVPGRFKAAPIIDTRMPSYL
ncbi:MAG: hypothetical protein AAFZ38_02815 [Myxococcota bacterium]